MFSKLPMFQRVGAVAYKKDLGNIRKLCQALGNPHLKYKTIHVAGTNGKGSTSHMLAAAFQVKSLKTGLYVSPHYKDYRERIKINGKYVSRDFVVSFIDKMKPLIEEINPSFFEINVAMAFDYFAYKKVDIAIIETGLGGRLDSTNIIDPEMSVITNISYDHMNLLGDTLEEIAVEKAGIIKPDTPVIIGEYQEEVIHIFEGKARENNADLSVASESFRADFIKSTPSHDIYNIYNDGTLVFRNLKLGLKGSYQKKNLITVICAMMTYNFVKLRYFRTSHFRKAFANVRELTNFMGRWQILNKKPLVICDSGHNEAGIGYVVNQINETKHHNLHMVIGMVNDKAIDKMLSQLPDNATYYFAKADVPRGLDPLLLKAQAGKFGLIGKHYASVKKAYKAALKNAGPKDLVFIGGSTFVVAEVL